MAEVINAATGVCVCQRCGEFSSHRRRSDTPKKKRSWCRECEAKYLKEWREKNWKRRKAYDAWKGMLRRCYDQDSRWANCPGIPQYRDYGGKGVIVCELWRDNFEEFLGDMGLPPTKDATLDRINPSRNYTKSNTRWTDQFTQSQNRKNTRWTTACHPVTGEELTLSLSEWGRRTGINRRTIGKRLDRGWSANEAVGRPAQGVRQWEEELEEVPF